MAMLRFTLNGHPAEAQVDDPAMPLLYLLREPPFDLNGPRFGCGLGQCGACTVHVGGRATRSCQLPALEVAGQVVVTLEGIGNEAAPHPVQAAFAAEGAGQCGYCTNGVIMQALDFLGRNRRPTEDDIREELADNLCRCGGHGRMVRAVSRAAAAMAG